ncbi:HAD family hydrolase [Actinoplanes sp. Pm04-4]|uniref:HAD family hydrolase n=1 Tax=Paractinoplanes pyxinae TaxID=2997416 RepID=A0ABT4BBA5_9ACTN|nr:HAD family hydrolase [Actinoplanes pyxinae]MCY1143795.1 HAD family hydrolase [Actinoplanes pyxinae]
MLLLLDLDNTLIDRAAAYAAWARQRFGEAEVAWLVEADRDGYRQREELARLIAERYSLDADEMLVELRAGMVEQLAPDPRVDAALLHMKAAGFVPVVVTNGTVAQQEAKLRRTGLDRLVAGWTISEGAGVRKPDRRIFEIAAASVGASLAAGGWMVGDNVAYDVGGGAGAGLHTAWVSGGRVWPGDVDYRPTVTAVDCVGALEAVVGAAGHSVF